MDYQKIIHLIADCLVIDCNDIDVYTKEEGKNIDIFVSANSENISRLIGKNGRTANAIREVISIIGKKNEKFTHVFFKSKDDSK